MKAILLFLFISLTGSMLAQTSSSYSPDSLKTGDWLTIEAVHYYSYIAPSIKEELPWRAENIRRVIFRATVTDKSTDALTIDFTLENLYDCRNDSEKRGFYYFDSHYQQDFEFQDITYGKRLSRVTYDWKSGNVLRVDKANPSYSYPGFVKRGQTAYPGNQRFSDRMEKGRDYPASTKYTDYRCLICPFSEYGIYLLLFRPWNNSQGLDCP